MKCRVSTIEVRLAASFESASGEVAARELLLLELAGADGHTGCGEAAPLLAYDGVSIADVRDALADARPILEQATADDDREAVLADCARAAVLPQALAAIDLALWDLAGRTKQEPVWRLLGAGSQAPIEVNYTIAAADRATAAREAANAVAAGFSCVKVKVGLGDDAGRIAAIRAAAGRQVALRLDANGSWSVREAAAALSALSPARIELCEQPVASLDETRELAALTDVPLALDEGVRLPGALEQRVCEAVCLKISGCGGISGLLSAAQRARAAGYEVYLASTLDGPLGIAAALHAATALRPERACGLATLGLFAQRPDPLAPVNGRIAPSGGPGLGEGLLGWYEAHPPSS